MTAMKMDLVHSFSIDRFHRGYRESLIVHLNQTPLWLRDKLLADEGDEGEANLDKSMEIAHVTMHVFLLMLMVMLIYSSLFFEKHRAVHKSVMKEKLT